MTDRILIFDTTLRDGEQSPGYSMNTKEKVELAKQLARLGVDILEAGFPIASQDDFEAVRTVAKSLKSGPIVAGLAGAKDVDIDRCWEAVKVAERPRIHTFVATSEIHIKYKLKSTQEEVLDATIAAVKRAKNYTPDVEFSAEDAHRTDQDYLCRVVEAAIRAGATTINIPDTVGYGLPWEFGERIRNLMSRVPGIERVVVSAHCHNDLGVGVANSLEAIREVEGARDPSAGSPVERALPLEAVAAGPRDRPRGVAPDGDQRREDVLAVVDRVDHDLAAVPLEPGLVPVHQGEGRDLRVGGDRESRASGRIEPAKMEPGVIAGSVGCPGAVPAVVGGAARGLLGREVPLVLGRLVAPGDPLVDDTR